MCLGILAGRALLKPVEKDFTWRPLGGLLVVLVVLVLFLIIVIVVFMVLVVLYHCFGEVRWRV